MEMIGLLPKGYRFGDVDLAVAAAIIHAGTAHLVLRQKRADVYLGAVSSCEEGWLRILKAVARLMHATQGKGMQSAHHPVQRLELRRTLRSGFRSQELGAELIAKLERHAGSGLTYFSRSSNQATLLAEATLAAFRQQTWNDAAQEELASWIRFTNGEARKNRDGLTPATMGISGFGGWVVRNFYDRSDVLKSGFREKGIEGVEKQVSEGAGWLILTNSSDTPEGLVSSGRAFERMALCARELGLALHPMSQTLEEAPWNTQLWKELGLTGPAHLIVRCGLVDSYPEPVSLRRPASSFMKG